MNTQTPKSNAIVVCDYAMQEAGTGKWSLIGVFSQIHSGQFPVTHHQLCVYLNFTDAEGHYRFRLELVDLDNEENLVCIDGEGEIGDMLSPNEMVFNLQNIAFPHPGRYEFRFWADSAIIAQKVFRVIQMEQPQAEGISPEGEGDQV